MNQPVLAIHISQKRLGNHEISGWIAMTGFRSSGVVVLDSRHC